MTSVSDTFQLYISRLLFVFSSYYYVEEDDFDVGMLQLCVGFPVRTRRGNHLTNTPVSPTPSAHAVANSLASLLARGLSHHYLPTSAELPKLK